jgi:pSer/pThr/pTyr-binding forkhead associated (FHA) protein
MPAIDLRDRLFCSYCGHQIGNVKVCPHCTEPNDFLDVTPPRSFLEESAKALPPAGTTKVARLAPAEVVAPAPAPSTSPRAPQPEPEFVATPAKDDDGPTAVLRLPDDDDRTVSLSKKKEEPEVFGVLLSQDPGAESIRHELREGTLTVGRKDAQILIPRDTISKKHALIQVERNGAGACTITVLDRGSENSTYVNDVRLKPNERCTLKDQDVIRFADVNFRLSVRS